MMKPAVYVETSVISYLASRPSRDLIVAGHQQLTLEWWDTREDWRLFVSPLVIREARGGDADAAARRLSFNDIAADQPRSIVGWLSIGWRRPARQCGGRRPAYRYRDRSPYGVSVDLELPPYRQRDQTLGHFRDL